MNIIRKLLTITLTSIAILNLQIRIVNTILVQMEERRKIIGYTLLMGGIVASALLIFTYFIQPSLNETIAAGTLTYSGYIAAIGGLIAIIFAAKRQWRWTFIISTLTMLAAVTGVAEIMFTGAGIGLIIIKASGEEILKTSASQSLTSHSTAYKSDVIVYSILAGLGFALFENIVYFISIGSVGQFIVRSLTLSILHGIFTGVIGYILWRHSRVSYRGYLLAYIVGIGLHATYNIGLTLYPVAVGLTFTIGGYFLLSYLLFKSDRLYSTKPGERLQ